MGPKLNAIPKAHPAKRLPEHASKKRVLIKAGELRVDLMTLLGLSWPTYFLVIYTIARQTEYLKLFTWGGVLVPALLTLLALTINRVKIPRETYLLSLVVFWALVSGLMAGYIDLTYFRFLTQMCVTSFLVACAVQISGKFKAFFWVFWIIGIYNTLLIFAGSEGFSLDSLGGRERIEGAFTNANLLGIFSAIGILGGVALLPEVQRWSTRALLIGGCFISAIGVIASASRGGALLVLFYVGWWSLVCAKDFIKNPLIIILPFLFVFSTIWYFTPWLLEETRLGERISQSTGFQDGSSEARLTLVQEGWRVALENPIFGASLGGLRRHSIIAFDYAHNDFADIASSLGLIGFLIYVSAYLLCWRRLSIVIKHSRTWHDKYWANIGRMLIASMILSGAVFRPNFTANDVWIMLGLAIGMGFAIRTSIYTYSSEKRHTSRDTSSSRA